MRGRRRDGADVYLHGDDPFHAWALAHRRRIETGDAAVWVAPLEYVVLRKLEYFHASGSDRHIRDVAVMLQVSRDLMDEQALDEWAGRLGLEDLLRQVRAGDLPGA